MSVLNQIAFYQDRRDEVPNQILAHQLVEEGNSDGIQEIVDNLKNKNKAVQSDCIKVLYEAGRLNPTLITRYTNIFIELLENRNNRLVWGAMMALAVISSLKPKEIYEEREKIFTAMKNGSVITIDNGILVLSNVAASNEEYCKVIFPFLLNHLKTCRAKEIPQHAEKIRVAVNESNKDRYIQVLEERIDQLSPAQLTRVKRLLKNM